MSSLLYDRIKRTQHIEEIRVDISKLKSIFLLRHPLYMDYSVYKLSLKTALTNTD